MGFTLFFILFVLIGSVSAANNNITLSSQDTYNEAGQEKILTGNVDSSLDEMGNQEILKANNENTTLKTSVGGDTFADIQSAISFASSGDTIELEGIYTGSGTAVIIDKDNLTIIGNDAILDAQGQSRILNITGTGIILKDIIFINGNVTDNGGAICWYGDNGTLNSCNFTNNNALLRGGAVYWYGANGTVNDSNFINNTAIEMGGAVYWCGANGTVNDSNFINNTAEKKGGGAIHWDSNSANGRINNCNFTNNLGTQKGGAICWCGVNGTVNDSNFINDSSDDQGGAIFWDPNAINGAVNNCSFINNTGPNGGAIYWFGPHGRMNGCNFTNNTATIGGAINWQKTFGLINNCNFINNIAESTGGAVYWEGSNGTGNNCNFINNRGTDGGAIYWYAYNGIINNCNFINNAVESTGGAVYWGGLNGTGNNCNFINNRGTDGGAIYWYTGNGTINNFNFINNTAKSGGGAAYFYDSCTVENCSFTGNNATNGSAINLNAFSNTNISNSRFLNNRANVSAHVPLNVTVNGNTIEITFMGQNNLLNAIYSNGDVVFTNVTYWGVKGITNTGYDPISLSLSNCEAGQNISVIGIVNGNILNTTKVTDGDGKIILENVSEYYLIVHHYKDSYYTEAEKTISNMNVNVTSQITTNRTVNITAKSNIPQDIVQGKLIFILENGDVINAGYAFNGTWWAKYTFDDYGDYKVNASYIGLDNVSINSATISVIKANSTVNITDVVLNYGETKNVTVTTKGTTGITAKINDTPVTVVNNYTIPILGLDVGNYTLTVTTIPDADHNPVTKTVNLIVNKAPTNITLINETIELKVNDMVENVAYLTPADAGNLTFASSDENIVSVDNGKILALREGTAIVTVSFAGNDNYEAAEGKNITVIVAAVPVIKVNTTLTSEDVVTVFNKTANVVATLTDVGGKPICDASLKIVLGNISETLTTNAGGHVSLTTDSLLPGNYTAEITFNGDDAYNPSNTTAKVIINKINTTLVVQYENGTIFATVTDADGNPVRGLKVGFAINGVKYVISDENGHANFTIGDLEPGYYSVKVMAYGNDFYIDSNQETVIVIKEQSKIFLRNALYFVLETKMVRVTLWDGHNKPIAGKTVHIAVADSKYSGVTDENGTAYIRVGIGFGVHNATVIFDGDEQYSSCNRSGFIRVIKETPSVMVRYTDTQFKVKDNPKTIKVYLWDRNSKPLPADSKVAIKLNGQTYIGYTDNKGVARISILLNEIGTFNAQAVYAGNSAYNAVARNIKITVSK